MLVVNDMDKCKQVQDMLADYRSGILSDSGSRRIEEHIGGCPECARELRMLDGVLALVETNIPQQEPPVGLWNGVYNRITAPEPARSPLDVIRQWIAKPVRAAGVGLAGAALVLGLIFGTGPRGIEPPMQMASSSEYVQGHALYAGQAPLADRIGYLSVVAASADTTGHPTQ